MADIITAAMPTSEEVYETETLDAVWVRSNGEAIEVKDMNEWHARNALRILINALASCDLGEAYSHLLGGKE